MFQRLWMRMAGSMLALVCASVAPGCRPAGPREAREVVPELKLEGVRFRAWRGADLRASGDARTATLRRDSTELHAREVVTVLPRSPLPIRITAPEGEGVLSTKTFAARGGVTLTQGNVVARTEAARYEPGQTPDDARVLGDDPLTVTGRGYRLQGTGFVLDPTTGNLDVKGAAQLDAGLPEAR